MTRYVCGVCGARNHIVNPEFRPTPRQYRILEALPALCRRSPKGTASTKQIALALGMEPDSESHLRTLRGDLQVLKQAGEVELPAGRCSGWRLKELYGLALKRAS